MTQTDAQAGKKKFHILAIDGGGIRGIIPATVLVRLEKLLGEELGDPELKLGEYFDLVSGTSTGGVISCLMVTPDPARPGRAKYSVQDALNLYLANGAAIFNKHNLHTVLSLDGYRDERYPAGPIEAVFQKYFGDAQLKDLIRPTLIPAFETKEYRPFFFTQHDANRPEYNFLVRTVTRSTTAAPTYFEMAQAPDMAHPPTIHPMVDGGVFANNPAMCAYVEAYAQKWIASPADCILLSVGTGITTQGVNNEGISYDEAKSWGNIAWTGPLIDILYEGASQTIDYQLAHLFKAAGHPHCYTRINGAIPKGISQSLDAADEENMRKLQEFGENLADQYEATLCRMAHDIAVSHGKIG
ncbi:MAG: patatin-like phospholipase family protein [Blastocatellia bacterium]|nr:patatin-like phospholipase family protein [Blastocatellia bacterium]